MGEPALRALMAKVSCEEDADAQREFPANMSGKLTIRARGGQAFSKMVVVPKGEPDNFLSEAELRAKFHGLADAVLGAERAARLADAILALGAAPDFSAVLRHAAPLMAARLAGE